MSSKTSTIKPLDILFAALTGLWSFALYIRTLAPSLLVSDGAEFQTLFYTVGMTHPTGYPVHMLIGKLFTLIPIRTIAYRANLASAFFAALAVAEIYLIVYLLGRWRAAAISGALALAYLPLYWRFAIVAESYSIASAFSLTILLLLLFWREKGNWQYLFIAGFLGGISVGVHGGVVMAAPAIGIYLLLTARKRNDWLGAITGALVGILLLVGAFIIVDRHDPPSSIYNAVYRPSLSAWGLTEEEFNTTQERINLILPASQALGYFFNIPNSIIKERFTIYQQHYATLAKLLMIVGLFSVFLKKDAQKRRYFPEAILLTGIFLPIWLFALTQDSSLYDQFFTLSDPFLYIWLGLGISVVLALSAQILEKLLGMQNSKQNLALALLSILIVIAPFWQNREDLILAWTAGYTRDIQKSGVYPVFAPEQKARLARRVVNKLEDNAIVFAEWDTLYGYYYVAHIERGLTGIAFHQAYIGDGTTKVADSLATYIAENIDQRPIYTTIPLLDLSSLYTFEPVSEGLMRLRKKE